MTNVNRRLIFVSSFTKKLNDMARISNNSDTTLSAAAQSTIQNLAANAGFDHVEAQRTKQYDDGEIFEVYGYDPEFPEDTTHIGTVSNPDGVYSN